MFQFELFDSGLVWSDCCALDSDFALFDGLSCIDGNLVVSFVTILDSKVKILDGHVEKGENEFIFYGFPDDSGHLISIEFDDWL